MADVKKTDAAPGDNAKLLALIDSLRVETNPRYVRNQLGLNETWCNRFAGDVARGLGFTFPDGVLINDVITSVLIPGVGGWVKCSRSEAEAASASGGLGLACLYELPHGHVQVLRGDGLVAQAGAENFSADSLGRGYSLRQQLSVDYFAVQRST